MIAVIAYHLNETMTPNQDCVTAIQLINTILFTWMNETPTPNQDNVTVEQHPTPTWLFVCHLNEQSNSKKHQIRIELLHTTQQNHLVWCCSPLERTKHIQQQNYHEIKIVLLQQNPQTLCSSSCPCSPPQHLNKNQQQNPHKHKHPIKSWPCHCSVTHMHLILALIHHLKENNRKKTPIKPRLLCYLVQLYN